MQELEPQIRRNLAAPRKVEVALSEQLDSENFSKDEFALVKILTREPLYIDELVSKSGQSQGEVSSILLKLELKKFVKQLPGKYFVRV